MATGGVVKASVAAKEADKKLTDEVRAQLYAQCLGAALQFTAGWVVQKSAGRVKAALCVADVLYLRTLEASVSTPDAIVLDLTSRLEEFPASDGYGGQRMLAGLEDLL